MGNSAASAKPDRGRGRGRGSRGRGNQTPRNFQSSTITCELCDKSGNFTHKCRQFKSGPEIRQRLKDLNRCDACLIHKEAHPGECPTLSTECFKCYESTHYHITFDGKHPGSWLKNDS